MFGKCLKMVMWKLMLAETAETLLTMSRVVKSNTIR